jgi:hypothetical protein
MLNTIIAADMSGDKLDKKIFVTVTVSTSGLS